MDERRKKVNEDVICESFATFCQTISGLAAHFVWNMDEMRHQTWFVARDTIYLVPSELPDRNAHYPVHWTRKPITLIACISVDGPYMHPALLISGQMFEDEFFLRLFTSEKFEIYSQTKADIDSDILLIDYMIPSSLSSERAGNSMVSMPQRG
jgi:hypothetical protein